MSVIYKERLLHTTGVYKQADIDQHIPMYNVLHKLLVKFLDGNEDANTSACIELMNSFRYQCAGRSLSKTKFN